MDRLEPFPDVLPLSLPEPSGPPPTHMGDFLPPLLPNRFHHLHIPPASCSVRWPGGRHLVPHPPVLCLSDVWPLLIPFLDPSARQSLHFLSQAFALGPRFTGLWLSRPWSPYRRRRWGFGREVDLQRTIVTRAPSCYILLHHIWSFLTPHERSLMSRTHVLWDLYASMRLRAFTSSVALLRRVRPSPGSPKKLPLPRGILHACTLLRFDFYYPDFHRWLSGEYTNRHRQWGNDFTNLYQRCVRRPPANLPPPQFDRAFRICTEGVPLAGCYHSAFEELRAWDRYNNHPAVQANLPDIEAKFAKEEEKSFHLHLPWFYVYFMAGLLLSPLQWVIKDDKGRICVDGTNGPNGPGTSGSPNTHIPAPKLNTDACPAVYYATAFQRHLAHLWRLRITFPAADILQHCDDIDAAFRRVLYHSALAVAFAYVFEGFLLIPVGSIFGGRSSPSYFSCLSDVRQYVATVGNFADVALDALVARTTLQLPPPNLSALIVPARADTAFPALTAAEQENFSNSTFVDDNGKATERTRTMAALQQSVLSAHILFGFPHMDRRDSSMNASKWALLMSAIMLYLGFLIDSRAMMVAWPRYKRLVLLAELTQVFHGKQCSCTPRIAAKILGKLRSAALIAPWGIYLSWSLSESVSAAVRASRGHSKSRRWWAQGKIRFSKEIQADLSLLMGRLADPEDSILWCAPVPMLLARTPMSTMLSDASYGGIGGWSPHSDLDIKWRITELDLTLLGFPMKSLQDLVDEPLFPDTIGLHINPP